MLCCAAVLFSHPLPPSCTTRHCPSLSVVVRVLRREAKVTRVCWCCCYDVMVPWRFLPAVSRWCAGATKAGILPAAVRLGLSWCRCCGASWRRARLPRGAPGLRWLRRSASEGCTCVGGKLLEAVLGKRRLHGCAGPSAEARGATVRCCLRGLCFG
jgi:hypothetical protein